MTIKDEEKIRTIKTTPDGKVDYIVFEDNTSLNFNEFIQLFKERLSTVCAGEVISWDDIWRFQRMTDAKSFEEYLDNVEQEGILKGSRFQLSRPQKIGIGIIILIVFIGVILLFALKLIMA